MKKKASATPPRLAAKRAIEAPTYWECPVCGFLTDDPRFADPASPCPHCSKTDGERRQFPAERLRRLDSRIRQYEGDGEYEIVVILVAAFLEAILEDILDRIMSAHGADVALRGSVLDAVRAIGGRIGRLFPDLTGEEFEQATAELGFRDFPKRWRRLREARNAFIHDSPFRGPQETLDEEDAAEAMDLLDQAYRLFVSMNNRFVADGRSGRRA